MALIETWFEQDLSKAVSVQYLNGNVFSQDNLANKVGVSVYSDGEPASLSGSISANVIRSDGETVAVAGSFSGNQAWVILPQSAYAIPGIISIIIKCTESTTITTLCAVVATVYKSSTDTVIDPGTIIPSIQTLISQINTAVASIPADYSSLWSSLAPVFSTSKYYTSGEYVTNNGVLYRFIKNHPAGTWTGTDVVAVNIGDDLSSTRNALQFGQEFLNTLGNVEYSKLTYGGYIRKTTYSGTNPGEVIIASGTNGGYTDFLPVKNATIVYTNSIGSSGCAVIAFYNSDHEYISGVAGRSSTAFDYYYAYIPSNATYVRFSAYSSTVTDKTPFTCSVGSGEYGVVNKIGNLVDEQGSVYATMQEMTNNLEKARMTPVYKYKLPKVNKRAYLATNGDLSTYTVAESTGSYYSNADNPLKIDSILCFRKFVQRATVRIFHGDIVNNAFVPNRETVVSGDTGKTLVIDKRYGTYLVITVYDDGVAQTSGLEYYELTKKSPYFNETGEKLCCFYRQGYYENSGDPNVVTYKDESIYKGSVYIRFNNIKFIYSEVANLDCALYSAGGVLLKEFDTPENDTSGNGNLLTIPEYVGTEKVDYIVLTAFLVDEPGFQRMYGWKNIINDFTYVYFNAPVIHEPMPDQNALMAKRNADYILNFRTALLREIKLTSFKTVEGGNVVYDTCANYLSGFTYSTYRNVGSDETYTSHISERSTYYGYFYFNPNPNAPARRFTRSGLTCSAFIGSILNQWYNRTCGSLLRKAGNKYRMIEKYSDAHTGDILVTMPTVDSQQDWQPPHVAFVYDKLFVGGQQRIIIAECTSATGGVRQIGYGGEQRVRSGLICYAIRVSDIVDEVLDMNEHPRFEIDKHVFTRSPILNGANNLTSSLPTTITYLGGSYTSKKFGNSSSGITNNITFEVYVPSDLDAVKILKDDELIATVNRDDFVLVTEEAPNVFDFSSYVKNSGAGTYTITAPDYPTDNRLTVMIVYAMPSVTYYTNTKRVSFPEGIDLDRVILSVGEPYEYVPNKLYEINRDLTDAEKTARSVSLTDNQTYYGVKYYTTSGAFLLASYTSTEDIAGDDDEVGDE